MKSPAEAGLSFAAGTFDTGIYFTGRGRLREPPVAGWRVSQGFSHHANTLTVAPFASAIKLRLGSGFKMPLRGLRRGWQARDTRFGTKGAQGRSWPKRSAFAPGAMFD